MRFAPRFRALALAGAPRRFGTAAAAFVPPEAFGTFADHTVARVTSSPPEPVDGYTCETLQLPTQMKMLERRNIA